MILDENSLELLTVGLKKPEKKKLQYYNHFNYVNRLAFVQSKNLTDV